MKKEIEIEEIGTIKVVRNEFLGSFKFYLDDQEFNKIGKNSYVAAHGEEEVYLSVTGSSFSGYSIDVNGDRYVVSDPLKWYEYILVLMPMILGVILGIVQPAASSGIYFVGGLIGGLIGGVMAAVSFFVLSTNLKWYLKVLIGVLIIAATLGILIGVGTGIVAAAGKK